MTTREYFKCRDRLCAFGYTRDEAEKWLDATHPQLNGAAAIDSEFENVSAIIQRLEDDAYL